MARTDICWHEFSKGAGVTLGLLLPLVLAVGAMMLAVFRPLPRHEEAMPEARLRADQVRESRDRVIPGGQGGRPRLTRCWRAWRPGASWWGPGS